MASIHTSTQRPQPWAVTRSRRLALPCATVDTALFSQESALFAQACEKQGGTHVVSFLSVRNTRMPSVVGASGPAVVWTCEPRALRQALFWGDGADVCGVEQHARGNEPR
jgi:hypothetical protein